MNKLTHLGNPLINTPYLTTSILGKIYNLDIKYKNINKVELNKLDNKIELILPKSYKNLDSTNIINSAIQKMYDKLAISVIDNAMDTVRYLLRFSPEDYRIERLKDVWYKCSTDKIITINPDIVKYNEETIITTLIQAFCKIRFKTNSNKYKETLKQGLENYELFKNNLNSNLRNTRKIVNAG